MTEPEVFVLADQALNHVVEQISDDQWALPVPDWFATQQTDRRPALREIVDYHAYDDAWVPDMLEGRTMAEAGMDKFIVTKLLGDDPKGAFALLVARACAAAREVTDLDRNVHCSFGDFTTRQYLWQTNMFRALRAVEIAKVIGVDSRLSEDLVQGVWEEVSPNAEQWRSIGVFGPEVAVATDAPLQERLFGLTGRDPSAGGG